MNMKHLNEFIKFDWDKFVEKKGFLVTGISELQDFESKKHLGTKIEVVIIEDGTNYKQKEGECVTNRFEKILFKIYKDVNVPLNSQVLPVNVSASIYGDYRNQLSVKAEDIKVIDTKALTQPMNHLPIRKE